MFRLLNRVDEALSDLDQAVELSGGCGQASKQAHTQRGLIRLLQEDEEGALKDFQVGDWLVLVRYLLLCILLFD